MRSIINFGQILTTVILSIVISGNAYADATLEKLTQEIKCRDLPIPEPLACYRKLSETGNEYATWDLSEVYGGKKMPEWGVAIDSSEAIRLKLLAFQQGSGVAQIWYYYNYIPPQPYKWEIGMSKNQVLHSIDGAPKKIVKTSTENGSTETWFYNGATLYFGPAKEWGLLKIIQENTAN